MTEAQSIGGGCGASRYAFLDTVALRAADWLGLAAAPAFAAMALLTVFPGEAPPPMLCSAADGAPLMSGMAPMYALMCAFHLTPWLRLLCSRRTAHVCRAGSSTPPPARPTGRPEGRPSFDGLWSAPSNAAPDGGTWRSTCES